MWLFELLTVKLNRMTILAQKQKIITQKYYIITKKIMTKAEDYGKRLSRGMGEQREVGGCVSTRNEWLEQRVGAGEKVDTTCSGWEGVSRIHKYTFLLKGLQFQFQIKDSVLRVVFISSEELKKKNL